MPYYRISLKAARGICNTVRGRGMKGTPVATAGFARAEGTYNAVAQVS
jgi:hypothetical protein